MKAAIYGQLAAFPTEETFRAGLLGLQKAGCVHLEAYTPYAVEPVLLRGASTPMALIMFLAGAAGAAGGFFLQWYAARDYPLNVGGRPLNSWPAFVPIGFELMVLTAALVGVLAFFFLAGFPRLHHPVFADPRFKRASQDRFFICIRAVDPLYGLEAVRQALADAKPESIAELPV
jgi:hypothetical protein